MSISIIIHGQPSLSIDENTRSKTKRNVAVYRIDISMRFDKIMREKERGRIGGSIRPGRVV